MPLMIELQEAGGKLKNKFNRQLDFEQRFMRSQSLGDFISNGFAVNDQFPSTLDGDPVVRTYDNFTINEGHTVTTVNRCKGLYLFINGDLTINGILSMTARGANAPGKFVGILPNTDEILFNSTDIFTDKGIITLPADGGSGGATVGGTSNLTVRVDGLNGATKFRGSGGGASGGANLHYSDRIAQAKSTLWSGPGSAGTSFSGGSGGGGVASRYGGGSAGSGNIDGGIGGNGRAVAAGSRGTAGGTGGAGAAGPGTNGWAEFSADGDVKFDTGFGNGAGGLIILIVKGNIIIGPTGKILSRGTQSPGISSYGNPATVATGGGSGGGITMLFHNGEFQNDGEISLTGGISGNIPTALTTKNFGGQGGTGHHEIIKY